MGNQRVVRRNYLRDELAVFKKCFCGGNPRIYIVLGVLSRRGSQGSGRFVGGPHGTK